MKKPATIILLLLFFTCQAVFAQQSRQSPAKMAQNKVNGTDVKVKYGSPSVKGRTIYGDLVPYDQVWRTGANEATTIEFSKDVTINGKNLAKGKYALFTIPGKDSWEIIFNKNAEQWGAFKYNKDLDALRIRVNSTQAPMAEQFLKHQDLYCI